MQAMYGIKVLPEDDPFIKLAEVGLEPASFLTCRRRSPHAKNMFMRSAITVTRKTALEHSYVCIYRLTTCFVGCISCRVARDARLYMVRTTVRSAGVILNFQTCVDCSQRRFQARDFSLTLGQLMV